MVIGNHEIYGGGTPEKFAERFGLPGASWSFTHKDAHFAIVDNAKGTFPDNTLAWLDRDLAAHPKGKDGITTLIVAMHIPPGTDGTRPHGTRYDYEERSAKLLAILKRHGVDAVLSGHEHMQHVEDWEGVLLLISGGAGAPLAPFQKYGYYRIDVENGKVRESFQRVRPAGKPKRFRGVPLEGASEVTAPGRAIPRRRRFFGCPSRVTSPRLPRPPSRRPPPRGSLSTAAGSSSERPG